MPLLGTNMFFFPEKSIYKQTTPFTKIANKSKIYGGVEIQKECCLILFKYRWYAGSTCSCRSKEIVEIGWILLML